MVDVNTQTCTPQGRDGASCKSPRLDAYSWSEETGTKTAACTVSRGAWWGTGCHLPLSQEGQGGQLPPRV